MPHDQPSIPTMLAELAGAIGAANLVTALIAINFITFALFGIDKARAEAGSWRIAESTLHGWALIGGTPGAYAGRALFRHKTRKRSFSEGLHAIAGLQGLVLAVLVAWWWWSGGTGGATS